MVKNKILIVTGMHRSGTSLITQWLNRCGLHVGDELLGAVTGNDEGHFEDLDFLDSHKALLKSRRMSDNGFTANLPGPLSHEEKDKLRDIIAYKNGFNPEWGWKDPRTCLFLDVYKELVPDAFYFVVLRDYQSVISSLVSRMYKQSEQKYADKKGFAAFFWKHFLQKKKMEKLRRKHSQRFLQIWIAYNQAILQHIKQLPSFNYVVADYTALIDNDRFVYDFLVQQWGFTLAFSAFKNIYKDGQIGRAFDSTSYIKDQTLIHKAVYIEESLRQQSILNHSMESRVAV